MKFTAQMLGGMARDKKLSGKKKSDIAAEGGEARAETLTAAERRQIASAGGKAKNR